MSSSKKDLTREELVYLSKLYEKAERYPDMINTINKFVELNPKLTKDERNILSSGYKNIISDKRASWRLLNSMEKKEKSKESLQLENIKLVKNELEKDLTKIIDEVLSIIDKYLIQNAEDPENKVYYMKLKADYCRYKCEYAIGKEFNEACSLAEKFIKKLLK